MKRLELILTVLQIPFDFLLLIGAGLTAFALRHTTFITAIRPVLFDLPFEKFFTTLIMVCTGWVGIFAISGLYRINPNRKFVRDITKIIMGCSTGFAAIAIYLFFTLQKFDSRFLVLTGWLLAIVYVLVGRLLMRGVKIFFYHHGIGLRRTIIIGDEAVAETIKETMLREPQFGYAVAGTYTSFSPKTMAELTKKLPDEIIFTNPKADEDETLAAVDFCNENHIVFKYSADLFATISTNMSVSTIGGIPIIELRRTRLNGWGRIFKRTLDIVGSISLLVLSAPICALVTTLIWIETGRPIIYRNERIGQYGRKFNTLKFRSMFKELSTGQQFGKSGEQALKKEAELIKTSSIKNGPIYKIKNDPRVTKLGRALRRWSIDELPQFWNVLKGDMSLVGPRPHQPREVEHYEKHHRVVLALRPGITGLAQISGRSDLSYEDEIRLDTFYIENWSLLMDVIILIKTPFIVLSKKGSVT